MKLGYELTYLDVDAYGVIDLAQLREVLREDTTLVSVMTGNNEIGTIQRIKERKERQSINLSESCLEGGARALLEIESDNGLNIRV